MDPAASARSLTAARKRLTDYAFQLMLYKHLYFQVIGARDINCRVIFLAEIPLEARITRVTGSQVLREWLNFDAEQISQEEWRSAEVAALDPQTPGIIYSMASTEDLLNAAVRTFNTSASEILGARKKDSWPAPEVQNLPDEQTCRDCDFLRSCPTAGSRTSLAGFPV